MCLSSSFRYLYWLLLSGAYGGTLKYRFYHGILEVCGQADLDKNDWIESAHDEYRWLKRYGI